MPHIIWSHNHFLLLQAAAAGDNDEVTRLLFGSCKISNAKDRDGRTALHLASIHGRSVVVETMLHHLNDAARSGSEDDDINAPDQNGRTPLHWATIKGHSAVVEVLLSHPGVDGAAKDSLGKPAMHYAVIHEEQAVADAFLGKSSESIEVLDDYGRTALHEVVERGTPEQIRRCLNDNVISLGDRHGRLPLHYAARNGCTEAVEILMAAGPNTIMVGDNDGRTAMYWAACFGHAAALKTLIDGAPRSAEVQEQQHAALRVAADKGHSKVTRLLVNDYGLT